MYRRAARKSVHKQRMRCPRWQQDIGDAGVVSSCSLATRGRTPHTQATLPLPASNLHVYLSACLSVCCTSRRLLAARIANSISYRGLAARPSLNLNFLPRCNLLFISLLSASHAQSGLTRHDIRCDVSTSVPRAGPYTECGFRSKWSSTPASF